MTWIFRNVPEIFRLAAVVMQRRCEADVHEHRFDDILIVERRRLQHDGYLKRHTKLTAKIKKKITSKQHYSNKNCCTGVPPKTVFKNRIFQNFKVYFQVLYDKQTVCC